MTINLTRDWSAFLIWGLAVLSFIIIVILYNKS